MRETHVQSLGWEDPLEKEIATHSCILDWRIPQTEEPGGLQSLGSQRVRHDWMTNTVTCLRENPGQLVSCWWKAHTWDLIDLVWVGPGLLRDCCRDPRPTVCRTRPAEPHLGSSAAPLEEGLGRNQSHFWRWVVWPAHGWLFMLWT